VSPVAEAPVKEETPAEEKRHKVLPRKSQEQESIKTSQRKQRLLKPLLKLRK
jgi:hypothetical protein